MFKKSASQSAFIFLGGVKQNSFGHQLPDHQFTFKVASCCRITEKRGKALLSLAKVPVHVSRSPSAFPLVALKRALKNTEPDKFAKIVARKISASLLPFSKKARVKTPRENMVFFVKEP